MLALENVLSSQAYIEDAEASESIIRSVTHNCRRHAVPFPVGGGRFFFRKRHFGDGSKIVPEVASLEGSVSSGCEFSDITVRNVSAQAISVIGGRYTDLEDGVVIQQRTQGGEKRVVARAEEDN